MLTQDEKLKTFLAAIDDYAEQQRKRILTELEASNRIAVERAEKETLASAYDIIGQRTADARLQISKDVSRRHSDAKRRLLEKRMQIENDVFARAEEKLRAFTSQSGYRDWLVRQAKCSGGRLTENSVLYLRADDMKYASDIFAALGFECTVREDESNTLGGFYAEDMTNGVALNATFAAALASLHDRFKENSKLSVL